MDTSSKAKRLYSITVAGNGSPTGATHHSVNGTDIPEVASLAITTYGDGSFYLLYFGADGGELTDTCHDSVDGAKRQAEREFGIAPDQWIAG